MLNTGPTPTRGIKIFILFFFYNHYGLGLTDLGLILSTAHSSWLNDRQLACKFSDLQEQKEGRDIFILSSAKKLSSTLIVCLQRKLNDEAPFSESTSNIARKRLWISSERVKL